MHIGRASALQPESLQQAANQARVTLDLRRSAPIVIAHASAPTGANGAPQPSFHPVTDLIQRQAQLTETLADAIPPPKRTPEETYIGTPPTPSIIDLRA